MTIGYQKQKGHEYGYTTTVYRKEGEPQPVKTKYGHALGRVIDKKNLIFFNRKYGVYKYDPATGKALPAPEGYSPPKRKRRIKVPPRPVVYPFGASYWLHSFMQNLNFYSLFDGAYEDYAEEIKAMICFYLTCPNSNSFAATWYESTFAKFLFKGARLSSQRISDLLEYLSEPSRQQAFFANYFAWFRSQYQNSDLGNILIDSTGLPNSIHFHLTAISNHNGDINNEARLVYVVQQSTELPIFFRCIPGNIVDVTTIQRTILELKAYGIDTHYSITDAGYFSEENISFFYQHKISFVMRLRQNRVLYKNLIRDHLGDMETTGKKVLFNRRMVRVKKVECKFCQKFNSKGEETSPGFNGYAYICVDLERKADEERRLREKVCESKDAKLLNSYDESARTKGVFVLVSKRSIKAEKILELYYTRQQIEQVFDFGKNTAGMLPLAVQKESTFIGHMVLTFMATIVTKLLAVKLKKAGAPHTLKPTLTSLDYQTCTIQPKGDMAISSEPSPETRKAFKAINIEYPVTVCIT